MPISVGGVNSADTVLNEVSTFPGGDIGEAIFSGPEVWLRTGATSTDVVGYPDATLTSEYVVPTGESFADKVASGDRCAVVADVEFWSGSGSSLFRSTLAGVLSTTYDISAQTSSVNALAWDGTYVWVLAKAEKAALRYTTTGVYTGVSFALNETVPVGLVWDGTHFWSSTGSTINQRDSAGVLTGITFSLSPTINGHRGMSYHAGYFWVLNELRLDQFTPAGFTGLSVIKPVLSGNVNGGNSYLIAGDDTHTWINDYRDDRTYKHVTFPAPYAGLKTAATSLANGSPLYTRIK